MQHRDRWGDGPGGRRARRSLALAGVTFALCGLLCVGLGLYVAYMMLTGKSAIDPASAAGMCATLLAFGAPLAASGALLLALPRRPGLARAADRALVAFAAATAAACVVVTVVTGRPMVIAAVGAFGAAGFFRGVVRQCGMR